MKTLTVKTPSLHGPDVKTLQTELRRRGWLAGANVVDGVYGTQTAAAVYRAKLKFGYAKPDHAAGDLFMAYLTGRKKPTAAMQNTARKRRNDQTPAGQTSTSASKHKPTKAEIAAAREAQVRATAVQVMHMLLAAEPRVHYAQIRPMRTRTIDTIAELAQQLEDGVTMDCSESSTLIAKLAGAKNPNPGHPYADGVGYTGTILDGPEVAKSKLRPGDFVVFGPGTGNHVCMVLEPGADPLLFSMGQEKGPIAIRLSTEAKFQAPPVRFRGLVV